MATAFSEKERARIVVSLRETARKVALESGMNKVTVEELASKAGISKGAFYKFYPSKELLFLEILEETHTQVYGIAGMLLAQSKAVAQKERAAETILNVCRLLEQSGMVPFIENDLPVLLQNLPEEVLKAHYHGDEIHVMELLHRIAPDSHVPDDFAAATVRSLLLFVAHRTQIGEHYPEVLELLVHGACEQLFGQDMEIIQGDSL
ncbi:MAG: helix-turn-helix transcriptional regulator [Clostridia bacterium]|nr:helix-turn-helix transcriptional regulator [Clostridia bacterium]